MSLKWFAYIPPSKTVFGAMLCFHFIWKLIVLETQASSLRRVRGNNGDLDENSSSVEAEPMRNWHDVLTASAGSKYFFLVNQQHLMIRCSTQMGGFSLCI